MNSVHGTDKPMRNFLVLVLATALMVVGGSAQQNPSTSTGQTIVPPGQPQASAATGQGTTSTMSQPGTPAQEGTPDPLLDVPPLPKTQVTLVGGTVTRIDRVRNRLTVEPFGGKKMKLSFDERTHIFRDGVETTQLGIRKGDRVYVDTQLDGSRIFARNIRVESKAGPADARGQIVSFDQKRGTMVVRDDLSSQPVTFRVGSSTAVRGKGQSFADLVPGSLVSVRFAAGAGDRGVAQEINISARPGETFTFAGKVTHLDLSSGILAVQNGTDGRTYEIRFDPNSLNAQNLAIGSDVAITAEFDGSSYKARNITVNQAKAQ
ncbi:MAG TPA: DUF5666 domain-containing protein [Terriglobales bacterium]|nr:DUF5666 domain-containing protein [Terriglobales bacterium]